MRLTLWHGGMVILTGLVLLTVTYVLFTSTLQSNVAKGFVVSKSDIALSKLQSGQYSPDESASLKAQLAAKERAVAAAAGQSLIGNSAIGLGLISVLALASGWVLAGRALRPLKQITSTARVVAGSRLHERIDLQGPHDELKELADTFDAMLGRLDRAFANQRRFVADASHELRTPLAVNRTVLEVAAARPDASDDVRALAGKLLETTARHEKLLDGLLTLARSDEGRATRTPVDLAVIAEEALEVSRRPAEKAGIDVRADLAPAPCTGDPVLLERVVLNLLQNAVTYNHSSGHVHLTTTSRDGHAELTVTNTGPLVRPDQTDEIFQPFHRLGPRTAGTGRVGLGLAIVRSVAVAHDGTATATAHPRGGLTVTVTLPGSA